MVEHSLNLNYHVVAVCRKKSVGKLDPFKGRISIIPGATDDRKVIREAVTECDGGLTVLVPWGHTTIRYGNGSGCA
jgi:polygalacturonase